jgi:hypothetical protein
MACDPLGCCVSCTDLRKNEVAISVREAKMAKRS